MELDNLDNIFLMSEGTQLMAEAQLVMSILGGGEFDLIAESSMVASLINRAKDIIKKIVGYIVRVLKRIIEFFTGKGSSGGGGGGGGASAVYQAAKVLLPSQITKLTDLVVGDSGANPKVKSDVKEIVSNMTVNNVSNTTNVGISKDVFDAILALYNQGEDAANKSLTKIATSNALNELETSQGERVIKEGMKSFIESVKAKDGARLRKIMYDDMIATSKQTIFIPRIMGATANECTAINKFIKGDLINAITDTVRILLEGDITEEEVKRLNVDKTNSSDMSRLYSFASRKDYAPTGTKYLNESFIKGHTSVYGMESYASNTPKEVETVLNNFYKKGSVINGGIEMLFSAPDSDYKLGLKYPKEAYGMVMSIIPTEIKDFNIDSTTNKQISFDTTLANKGVETETIDALNVLIKLMGSKMDNIFDSANEKIVVEGKETDAENESLKKEIVTCFVNSFMTIMNASMYLSTIFTVIGPKFLDYIKMVSTYNDTVEANLDLVIGEEFIRRVREIRKANSPKPATPNPTA